MPPRARSSLRWRPGRHSTWTLASCAVAVGASTTTQAAVGRGKVIDATWERAFVDVGRIDGLRQDAVIRIGGANSGLKCRVDRVSDHFASCAVEGARVGQPLRFRVDRKTGARPPSNDVKPRLDSPEPAAVSRALSVAPVPKLVHEARPSLGLEWRAVAALTHQSWVRSSGSFHRERVDATIADIPLGFLDVRASADFTVLGWSARPGSARFRADDRALLFVHETAVHRRVQDGGLTLGLGRIRPWFAPGIAYLDGVQIGYRPSSRSEVGLLGGLLPDVVTLSPDTEHWTAGVYGAYRAGREHRFSAQGRLGVVTRPGAVGAEAETVLGYRYDRWASVRGALRFAYDDRPLVSSVRAAIQLQPTPWLDVDLRGRLRDDRPDPGAPEWTVVGADHGRGSVWVRIARTIRIGAVTHTSHLRADDLWRHGVGPQVTWQANPSLRLHAGYQEAFGWLPGRTGFMQMTLRASDGLRLSVRGAYLADEIANDTVHTASGYGFVDWRTLWPFDVRVSSLLRVPFAGRDDLGVAVTARLTIVGRF